MWHVILEGNYDSYDNSAGKKFWGNYGCGILAIEQSTKKILVSLRSKYVNEPNTWGVIGGKVDNEDIMSFNAEAIREFKEETQYNGPIELRTAYLFKTEGFQYQNFIGIIPEPFNAIPDWESEKFEWVTFEELMQLEPKHFGLKKLLDDKKSIDILQDVINS